jgi:hypothetical protein
LSKIYIKWEDLNVNWENIDLLWEEIVLLIEVEKVIRGGGGYGYKEYVDNNPWKQLNKEIGKEKTKKVISVYCKLNNLEFDESREVDDNNIKISTNEFERFIKESINVKVDF